MSDPFFTEKYPIKNSAIIQLFSLPTPNGRKVSIALEEMEIDYEAHRIDIMSNEQFSDAYKFLNPNSKIPSIWEPNGPDGKGIAIMESGAILLYLAEKTGSALLPSEPRTRLDVMQWLMFQMGGVGPFFGQAHHFLRFAKEDVPYAKDRYRTETHRLYGVMDKRLAEVPYLAGQDYSLADVATYPWAMRWEWHEIDGSSTLEVEFKKSCRA